MIRQTAMFGLVLSACWAGMVAAASGSAPPGPGAPYRAPYQPTDPAERLQEVPSAADPAVVVMRTLRLAFDAAPGNLPAAIKLADAYVDYSRQIGDAHYAGYAEAVISPWTSLAAPPASALVTEATILQYRHQFADARVLLKAALHVDPMQAQAWLTLATLDMVQGDYKTASRDCAQVTNTSGIELGLACVGNLRSYTGQARQSLALLQQVESAAAGAAPVYRAWVQGLIAETAERLGDWESVETHYVAALKLLPEDNFLLVAYADFLLDRGRPQEVLPLLATHEQSDTAFLRLALAHAALGNADAAQYVWLMGARFEALKLRGSDYFGREEARFALQLRHDAQTSLDMAERNWKLQRAPWDARVLLEAAVAAHQPAAAADVLAFVETTKLEDPVVDDLVHQVKGQMTRTANARATASVQP